MRFLLPNGRKVWKNIEHTRIDWEGKSISKPQYNLKIFLKKWWSRDIVYEEMPIPQTRLRCDFVNFTRKIAIEEHGLFHENYSKWAHKSRSGFLNSLNRDKKKKEFLELNGFLVLEIYENEVSGITKSWFETKFNIKL